MSPWISRVMNFITKTSAPRPQDFSSVDLERVIFHHLACGIRPSPPSALLFVRRRTLNSFSTTSSVLPIADAHAMHSAKVKRRTYLHGMQFGACAAHPCFSPTRKHLERQRLREFVEAKPQRPRHCRRERRIRLGRRRKSPRCVGPRFLWRTQYCFARIFFWLIESDVVP